MRVWDPRGYARQNQLDRNITSIIKHADAVMIVFDVTDRESFENAKIITQKILQASNKDIVMVLIGNKIDLD